MDYAPSFFAQPLQPFFGIGVAPTTSFADEPDKMASTEPLDASMFPQYENFQFAPELIHTTSDLSTATGPMVLDGIEPALGDTLDFLDQDITSLGLPGDRRSSSEEKDNLTPAQSRRKAQNRAAQRAFRERKEKHVKDLETKLAALESSATTLASDNQRLQLALQRATTENEILRSTSQPTSTKSNTRRQSQAESSDSDGFEHFLTPGYSSDGDGALLGASATWDLIQSHPLVRQGHVDIADVCDRLRGSARCDGSGPVFAEREVRKAVEESRRSGGDELL